MKGRAAESTGLGRVAAYTHQAFRPLQVPPPKLSIRPRILGADAPDYCLLSG